MSKLNVRLASCLALALGDIAIEGCCHGELDNIYAALAEAERNHGVKVDILLICGDFQAVREMSDLDSMAVPPKHRHLGTFHKYYNGEVKAPVLTVFIGGNHEASNYHQELPLGGWAAPNIYYMGYASVLQFGGLRIAGLSGIFKDYNYDKGHYERLPLSDNEMRSVYHVRQLEVFKLLQIREPLDIALSHDWPRGVYRHGDLNGLLRQKPFFKEEIDTDTLGSPPAEKLLNILQPSYWFSAHLHVKFSAVVRHPNGNMTRFLALDKCLPRREFLQIMTVDAKNDSHVLQFDPEWLSILRSTKQFDSNQRATVRLPSKDSVKPGDRFDFRPTPEEISEVTRLLNGDLTVPHNFSAARVVPGSLNPQTAWLFDKLNLNAPPSSSSTSTSTSAPSTAATTSSTSTSYFPAFNEAPPRTNEPAPSNPDEIDI